MRENWIGVVVVTWLGKERCLAACDFCHDWCYHTERCKRRPRLVQIIEAHLEAEAEAREAKRASEIMLEVAREYGI
jgi:cytochrome c553